jgi:hypothetical protein
MIAILSNCRNTEEGIIANVVVSLVFELENEIHYNIKHLLLRKQRLQIFHS